MTIIQVIKKKERWGTYSNSMPSMSMRLYAWSSSGCGVMV